MQLQDQRFVRSFTIDQQRRLRTALCTYAGYMWCLKRKYHACKERRCINGAERYIISIEKARDKIADVTSFTWDEMIIATQAVCGLGLIGFAGSNDPDLIKLIEITPCERGVAPVSQDYSAANAPGL